MRVNVYNEELTGRVEPAAREANGTVFKGVRCYFKFKHETIPHNTPVDDDTPAVTFWFQDDENSFWRDKLRATFVEALRLLDTADAFNAVVEKAQAESQGKGGAAE